MALAKAKIYIARRRLLLASMVQRHQNLAIGYDKGPMPMGHGRLRAQIRPVDPEAERRSLARARILHPGDEDAARRAVIADESLGDWDTKVDDDNLVVLQAEALMAQMAIQSPNSGLNYIELGDPAAPATPPQITDITLQSTTGQRKAATLTVAGGIVTADVLFLTTEANGVNITDLIITNPAHGASEKLLMWSQGFTPFTKTTSNTLTAFVNHTSTGV